MIPHVVLLRDFFFDGQASLGSCLVYDENKNRVFKGVSLERGWVNNQNRISCIPEGKYPLVLEWSPRFEQNLWEIKNVPGRSECKFHVANYWWELNGCVALGKQEKNIDGDRVMDVNYSRITMERFHKALEGHKKAWLTVIDVRDLL